MSTRSFLYDRFENYDKPTEDDFRVFIDSALLPTTFTEYTLPITTDVLTDINTLTFVLDIRECYLVYYGSLTYVLFGLEGTYGLGGTAITDDNLKLIAGGETLLSKTITANTSIPGSGISSGDSFAVGTPIEDVLEQLLVITEIGNLRYEANDVTGFLEVGTTLSITKFLWDAEGEPESLVLSDTDGQINIAVTGTQETVAEDYVYSSYKELSWTLSGSNVDTSTVTAYWVEGSYYGTNATGVEPIEAEILAGTKVLVLTSEFIEVPINTSNIEYGWVAVPATQTGSVYTTWMVNVNSTANIGSTEFIKYSGDVTVGGTTYNVYLYNWISEAATLKLS